ncbi:putative ribonuclease H-like domain-containing protein [Tanacetum coccineum]
MLGLLTLVDKTYLDIARVFNTVRPSYTAHPKSTVHCARPRTYFQNQAQSTVHRPFYKRTTLTKRSYNQKFNTGRPNVNTGRQRFNTGRARGFNVVKPSACWVWRPIKPNGASLVFNKYNYIDARGRSNGCSRHMTGNITHLSDFKDFNGGYVTFGGGAYGGRITGKGTIKTDNLDFDDVYFVKELKFNLFSVSQMCDKKNYVLFTDSECLVLSPNFKLPDENQILLKIPRQDNMYSFDMKNIVPKDSLTCLVAKATSEESMLWHRRLGHINFKNINKLVKENLVRDLPLKRFENDQTCVACLKGKQHRASCKTKAFNPITKPLFMLHMDLFGPTFVSSLMHKKYCLVVTDDYSRFSWVFFLTTKDETSEILKNFIKEVENLVDKKVKIIRSDNGTEFKNKVMDDFCREKGIKREYSVARTPQQNGVAERKNRTLIEAARTMLADSKLPTTFWAEAVSTACYVQNRVLIVKPHNKTPYELFRGFKPAIGFMKPFGCHVTILNTLDNLGKFDEKSDEGFFVGYSLSSKAFRVYNTRTRKVQENLHIGFLENKPMIEGNGPKWLFDLDSLTQSMNYVPVVAGTFLRICKDSRILLDTAQSWQCSWKKSKGVEGFHQVNDFLSQRTAEASTDTNGEVTITAIIDGQSKSITKASLRRHLKLEDHDGITSIPNSEIFEQLALMGYQTDSDRLTFQKGVFSPQWRFLIHTLLYCLIPKKTIWEQFSSNIATARICLATNRKYNFSRMIFEHMVTNIGSPHKFLMYPRFIQICLDMQKKQLKTHSSTYPVPSLNNKVFSNMRRLTKGYTGVEIGLFPTMLTSSTPESSPTLLSSPSRITSSPLLSSEPSTEPIFEPQPSLMLTGSLKLIELTSLVTKLSERIGVLEDDLMKTKQTYSSAFTKFILRIKKLEATVKTVKARKRARVVLSEDEEDDSSKPG